MQKAKEKLDRRDLFGIARIVHGMTDAEFASTVGDGGVHVNSLRQHLRGHLASKKIEAAVNEFISSAMEHLKQDYIAA